jgi:hypothetical protein
MIANRGMKPGSTLTKATSGICLSPSCSPPVSGREIQDTKNQHGNVEAASACGMMTTSKQHGIRSGNYRHVMRKSPGKKSATERLP